MSTDQAKAREAASDPVDFIHMVIDGKEFTARLYEKVGPQGRRGFFSGFIAGYRVGLAERDAVILALREALEEIRQSLPYPSDHKGQKVEGGEWSVPPSTARELRRIVGTRVEPSALLANTEAAARQAKLRVIREFVKKCENAGSPHLYAADRAWAFRDTARHELVALEQEQAK